MAQPLLPNPPHSYDQEHQTQTQDLLEELFTTGMKTDKDNILDLGTLILKSPDGSFWNITVDNAGNVTGTSITVDSNGNPITSSNPYV